MSTDKVSEFKFEAVIVLLFAKKRVVLPEPRICPSSETPISSVPPSVLRKAAIVFSTVKCLWTFAPVRASAPRLCLNSIVAPSPA
jgi:hypothetical protein